MAVTVKKVVLWKRELQNKPGTLAETLRPFAKADVNLQVVMGYSFPRPEGTAAVEVYPVTDGKSEQAAREAGLSPAKDISCLLVEGDDRAGLGYEISDAISKANINLHFAMFNVIQNRYLGIFGFGSDQEAQKAEELIKKAHEVPSRT